LSIKFDLWHKHQVNQDWLESIPFWEYQDFLKKLNFAIEDKNKKNVEKSGMKEAFSFGK